tara:strand:+ start:664 stop:876 length:213 start_codon:yes stop_codon:yes gene_type:complete
MDANELREMADKYDALQALKSKLEEAYCVLEEIEHACSHLDIMPSHHASMEIGDCMCEVDEALSAIENLL